MDSIDWSKAPESATHATAGTDDYHAAFWRKDGNEFVELWVMPDGHEMRHVPDPCPTYSELKRMIERPVSAVAWTGAGLPPVGTVCEYNNFEPHPVDTELKWSKVTIVCHDKQGGHTYAVFSSLSGYHGNRDPKCFRPLKTPEQIEAEEREAFALKLVTEMGKDPETHSRSMVQARKIFDLGYRKQGEPK